MDEIRGKFDRLQPYDPGVVTDDLLELEDKSFTDADNRTGRRELYWITRPLATSNGNSGSADPTQTRGDVSTEDSSSIRANVELPRQEGFVVQTDIFPIFVVEMEPKAKTFTPTAFCGTGFVIAPELVVTCWHCVRTELPENSNDAAVFRAGEDDWNARKLSEISPDANGHDLAAARVEGLVPQLGLTLPGSAAAAGTDVWTYGYPMTERRRLPEGHTQFHLTGRWLEGYIVRPP